MKTGIELIAEERQKKQIEKHGFTGEHHANHPEWYDKSQLIKAACLLAPPDDAGCGNVETPEGWDDDWFERLMDKPHKERLIIAGALIAAELDRINYRE